MATASGKAEATRRDVQRLRGRQPSKDQALRAPGTARGYIIKSMTKVGLVSEKLTNGRLPLKFTTDIIVELAMQIIVSEHWVHHGHWCHRHWREASAEPVLRGKGGGSLIEHNFLDVRKLPVLRPARGHLSSDDMGHRRQVTTPKSGLENA